MGLNFITGGPLKAGIAYVIDYGAQKFAPPEVAEYLNNATTALGTAGISYLYNSDYEKIKEEYNDQSTPRSDNDVIDMVDGLVWIVSNVIGLKGDRRNSTVADQYYSQMNGGNNNGNSGNGSGNNSNGTVTYTPRVTVYSADFDEHAIKGLKENGKHKINNGSIDGAHNMSYFEEILKDPRGIPGDPQPAFVKSRTEVKDSNGVVIGYTYKYYCPATEKGGTVIKRDANNQVVYMSQEQTKTVYNPRVISDEQYLIYIKVAGSKVYHDPQTIVEYNQGKRIFDVPDNDDRGLNFKVYLSPDATTGQIIISNVHLIDGGQP